MPTLQRRCLSFKDRHPSEIGLPFNEDAYPSKKMPTLQRQASFRDRPTLQRRCLPFKDRHPSEIGLPFNEDAYPSKKMPTHKASCPLMLPTLQRRCLLIKAAYPSKKTLVHQSCLSTKAAYPSKKMPSLQAACQEAKHPWLLPVLDHFQQNINAPSLASSQVIKPSPCKHSRGKKIFKEGSFEIYLFWRHGGFVIPAVKFTGISFWVLLALSLT